MNRLMYSGREYIYIIYINTNGIRIKWGEDFCGVGVVFIDIYLKCYID